uniref:Uncharacterized protein n=1 Tax=Urocitellus parryii TaxID=9999 RepID=A0A8D2KIE9_UROPR
LIFFHLGALKLVYFLFHNRDSCLSLMHCWDCRHEPQYLATNFLNFNTDSVVPYWINSPAIVFLFLNNRG